MVLLRENTQDGWLRKSRGLVLTSMEAEKSKLRTVSGECLLAALSLGRQ